jgi:hypothetical protein
MEQPRPRRGWVSLYAAAFVLLLVAAVIVALATVVGRFTPESLRLLRLSMWVSSAGIVAAVASVLVVRRR